MKKETIKTSQSVLLILGSGIILGLSFSPFPFGPIAFVGFVPLLYALERLDQHKSALLWTWLSFFIWHAIVLRSTFMIALSPTDKFLMVLLYGFYALLMCAPVVIFIYVKQLIGRPWSYMALVISWGGYEYLQNNWDLSMTFLNLGHSFMEYPVLLQSVQHVGVIGLGQIILAINILIYTVWFSRKGSNLIWKVSSAAVMFIFLAYGYFIFNNNAPQASAEKVRVAQVQPDFNPYEKVTKEVFQARIQILRQLSLQAGKSEPDLIVWHESAVQGQQIKVDDMENSNTIKYIQKIANAVDAPILSGMLLYQLYPVDSAPFTARVVEGQNIAFDVFNTAVLVPPVGAPQIYFKQRMVPMAEKVPFIDHFPWLHRLQFSLGDSYPSYAVRPNNGPLIYKNMRITPVVCIEMVYLDHIRELANMNSNLITIMTNEGWTGQSASVEQLAYLSTLVAIANGKSTVKTTNNGPSAFIAQNGEIISQTAYGKKGISYYDLTLTDNETFFSKNGELSGRFSFYALLFIAIAIFFFRSVKICKSES